MLPQPAHQRVGEGARTTGGHGEAVRLAEHRHQPAEAAAARGLGGEVGVQGVARQQQSAALAAELLLPQPAHRQHQGAGQPQSARPAQPQRQPGARADRRERGEQGVQQIGSDAFPHGGQLAPGVPVAVGEGVQGGGGVVDVAAQHGAPAVAARVGQYAGRVRPAQPVTLQFQAGDDRRGGGQRVEGAEQVVDEVGVHVPVVPDGTAGFVLLLQDLHAPAGVGEQIGGDQAVGARADHHGVRHDRLLVRRVARPFPVRLMRPSSSRRGPRRSRRPSARRPSRAWPASGGGAAG